MSESEPPASEPRRDSVVEVDPEILEGLNASARVVSHLPPPPPSLRTSAASQHGRPLQVEGTPRLARDLMTRRLLTIGPDDNLEQIEAHMQEFRFRHLPVIESAKLVGLISYSDLLHASSSFLSDHAAERDEIIHQVAASRIMQRELITVRPTDLLSEVAVLMWEARVGCVLVTEEDGALVGIITEGDFIRLAHHFLIQAAPT